MANSLGLHSRPGTTATYHFKDVLQVYHDFGRKGFKCPHELVPDALEKYFNTYCEHLLSRISKTSGIIDYSDSDHLEELLHVLSRCIAVVFCPDKIQLLCITSTNYTTLKDGSLL
eukprot:NODE_828_length_3870_cov_0.198091.p2 type:complete len:115 gc:universal NODE_828_length_3870_cov_0.198091:1607-1951(+)